MKNTIYLLFLIGQFSVAQNYYQYVNPLIGTGGHGHTFPGATLPFGMVQLSPDTRIDGSWDGCSGYHYSDSKIYGFSHTHLSGTGVSDYGDILLMPTMGEKLLVSEEYASKFSHEKEKATAGYYAVHLDKYDIDVELTTSTRVGFHKYKFNKSGEANIILDLKHRDKLLDGKIKIIDNKTIEVYRQSTAWAVNQQVWAKIEFSQSMSFGEVSTYQNSYDLNYVNKIIDEGVVISKKVNKGEELLVKVSLSFTGYEGARLNALEIKDWDFENAKKKAETTWNKALSKIEVQSSDEDKLITFYTALYHTMIHPNIAQDLNGKYRGRDNKIHQTKEFKYYTVFSLWDTFRAAHPLYTLIEKRRTVDFINTFIAQYEQGGRLPVWELASNETDCMIGYHSVSVMADAMMKGFTGFDYEKAFEAAKHSAMLNHFGLENYKKKGFIAVEDEHESISKTLEYAYDDWCIAQMAFKLGKVKDYQFFIERSQNWKNIFDPKTRLMRPKKNGAWLNTFDPKEVNNHFTEGNSWQYSFFVPQDIEGLINAHGGKVNFERKLDQMFTLPSATTGRHQVDITGLIGQYAHGNEPSHHVAYLYNYVNKPEKTKKKVHYILDKFYKNSPDGLIGNEDCGQMSAWYILSAMGIYAVTPGQIEWQTTTPYFDSIKINFEDGSSRTITKNTSTEERKNLGFERTKKQIPQESYPIVPVPYFKYSTRSFSNKISVTLNSLDTKGEIFYQIHQNGIDESLLENTFTKYTSPFWVNSTSEVISYVKKGEQQSKTVSAQFYKRPNNYTIKTLSKIHPQYIADGTTSLLDGIRGDLNWRKGEWQGFQGTDFEAIIDMRKVTEVRSITATFLQDARSWILFPKKIIIYTSTNGKNYKLFGEYETNINATDEVVQIENMEVTESVKKARYLKIVAENFGKLPTTHISAGEPSFIFIDEITIE